LLMSKVRLVSKLSVWSSFVKWYRWC
jgi:hypothetical protein